MTGDDLIDLASHLIVNTAFGNAEARYRTAISRAYYGAFHISADFLKQIGKAIPANHTGHELAYRLLFQCDVKDAMDAARALHDLRRSRNRADYELSRNAHATFANAKKDVERAHSLRRLIETCSAEPTRSAIRATLGSI